MNWWVKTIFLNLLTQEKEPEKNCGTKYGGEDVDGDVAVGEESLADLGDVILGEDVAALLCHQLAQPLHHPQQQVCHCLALWKKQLLLHAKMVLSKRSTGVTYCIQMFQMDLWAIGALVAN